MQAILANLFAKPGIITSLFLNILSSANDFINKNKEGIITIGIKPNRPEIGYGYINYGDDIDELNNHSVKKVNRFVEKPN